MTVCANYHQKLQSIAKMMNQKKQFKYAAQLLVLIYLFLTAFMTVGMERHALGHGRNPNHAAQHTTFTCNWMCAASTFVHTSDQNLNSGFIPSIAKLSNLVEQIFHKVSVLSYYARPPPFFLS
ncbi:MAG: hypothetical protein ABGX83_06080 [Nitrospira sp.]